MVAKKNKKNPNRIALELTPFLAAEIPRVSPSKGEIVAVQLAVKHPASKQH